MSLVHRVFLVIAGAVAVVLRRTKNVALFAAGVGIHIDCPRPPVGSRLAAVTAHVRAGERGAVEGSRAALRVIYGGEGRIPRSHPEGALPRDGVPPAAVGPPPPIPAPPAFRSVWPS